ncbi:hypothetical protein CRUP_037387 [Coryphaenoides rupestris]|nr:hypothetical protein CRUP_037387 [Coryphaenoides rupestris]
MSSLALRSALTACRGMLKAGPSSQPLVQHTPLTEATGMQMVLRGTRDIGSGLTRMCMRHRGIEGQTQAVLNYKRARQEIKKKSSDTLKLQKKAKKGKRNLSSPSTSAIG